MQPDPQGHRPRGVLVVSGSIFEGADLSNEALPEV